MATEVGEVYFQVGADTSSLTSGIMAGGQAFQALGKFAKVAGGAIAAALAVKEVVQFTSACIDLGSNLAEVQNVVDTTFGSLSSQVNEFAQNAITSAGLSETVAKKYSGTFGAMASSMGITGQSAVDLATQLTQLAGDVSSFYNISSDESYTKLKSIFTGETESLKELGVVMTQTNLDAYALANGYGKTTSAMTEQEKIMLRYAYVTQALSGASGDFIRTQDSWANQTRVLSLQWSQFKANLGQGFIAILSPILQGLNAVLGRLVTVSKAFGQFMAKITGKKSSSNNAISDLGTQAVDTASNIAGIGTTAQETAKQINRSLAGFDEINKLSDNSDSSSGSGGVGGGGVSAGSVDLGTDESVEESSGAIDKLVAKFQEMAAKVTAFLAPIGERFKVLFDSIVEMMAALWGRIQPIVQPIIDFFTNMFQIFLTMWSGQLQGLIDIITGVVQVITGLLNGDWTQIGEGVKNIVKGVCEFVWSTISGIVQLIENIINSAISIIIGVIQTAWEWIMALLSPVAEWFGNLFLAAGNAIMTAWGGVKGFFSDVWEGIKSIFGNVAGWFKSIFSNAWSAVLAVFSAGGRVFAGIKEGILSVFKTVVNSLIGGINTVVAIPFKGINKALQSVRDVSIMGAKPFKGLISLIDIPQIPKLATGGYIGANQPTLAMIGDNKHAGEIVAPEDKLLDIATKANNNTQVTSLLTAILSELKSNGGDVVMNIDGQTLARAVKKATARYDRRYNNVGLEY